MRLIPGTRVSVDFAAITSAERLMTPTPAGGILILWKDDVNEQVREAIRAIDPAVREHLCAVYAHDDTTELLWDSFGPPAGYESEITL